MQMNTKQYETTNIDMQKLNQQNANIN